MDAETIKNIKGRIAQCRRLAAHTTDDHVAKVLLQMAAEGEADLQRLEAEITGTVQHITIEAESPTRSA